MAASKHHNLWYLWLLGTAGVLFIFFFFRRKRDKDKEKKD
jgi:hypothetical protein